MRGSEISLLERHTGKGLDRWNLRAPEAGPTPTGLRSWLTEQGRTGHPQMLLVAERFGYSDFLLASGITSPASLGRAPIPANARYTAQSADE